MRPFEVLLFVSILPVLVWPLLPWKRQRWIDFLPLTAVIVMVFQLVVEGYRWQMLPVYALVVILFLITLPRLWSSPPSEKKWSAWSIIGGVLGLVLWLAALALAYLLPVPQLPDVTGSYAVGTQTYHLVDESRDEIYTPDEIDKREIMMQVWYPAETGAAGEPAVYLQDLEVMGSELAERLGLPAFLLDHINLVDLGTQKDVPVLAADAPYPVLIFSHGLAGMRGQNTAMVLELVSHGFVVATIDHTYGNVLTVFPDGRVALFSPDLFSDIGDPPHTSNTLVKVWADDIDTVLDQLTVWNEMGGSAFDGRLDLSKVGVFGHSTGGGTTVEFCGRDERCKVGAGLDAWVEPVSEEIVTAGLDQPFLFLRADKWVSDDPGDNFVIGDALFAGLKERGYLATIRGAAHFDFSDIPLLSPLTAQLGLSSDMDSEYVVNMMNSMVSAFFRQELMEENENLVEEAMVYPEMAILVGKGR